ncbi:MAG TPA: hypothetical protein VFQ05_06290, partial [Candidatus Eisenbacteria bacterium]|nr:hypothetical protein [Candidatus Eisenbacteria bacterium]
MRNRRGAWFQGLASAAWVSTLFLSPALGAPVQTDPPNVPEFKPAFPGQTRAEEVKTQTPLEVTEIA